MKELSIKTLLVTVILEAVILGGILYLPEKQEDRPLEKVGATIISVRQGGTGISSTSADALIVSGTTENGAWRSTSSPTVGYIYASSTATSTFIGGISTGGLSTAEGIVITGGAITDTSVSTSTFSGGLSTAGLSTSGGLLISAGSLVSQGSATSTFTGGVSASSGAFTNGLTITGGGLLNTSSATSTFTGGISSAHLQSTGGLTLAGAITNTGVATSTFVNGINLTGGCLLFQGSCLGAGGSGTVTSVDGSGGTTGLTLTGGPITTSGTLTLGGTLVVANGGTGSTTLGGILVGNGTSAVSATATISVHNGGTGLKTLSSGDLLVGNGNAALLSTSTLTVSKGGTGAASFTANSILVGNSNGALIASTTLGDDVISDGLTLTNLTQITNRAISDTTGTLAVGRGGTGATTLGDTELLVGAGTNAVTSTSTLSIYRGGTGRATLTLGNVLFGDTTSPVGLSANFYWDNVNLRLGISTGTPAISLSVHGNALISGTTTVANLVATGTAAIRQFPTFTYATSTTWTGTTTVLLGTAIQKETWDGAVCRTDVGTLNVQFYNSSLLMTMLSASTASSTSAISTNNALPALTNRKVDIGTPASSPKVITCTINKVVGQ